MVHRDTAWGAGVMEYIIIALSTFFVSLVLSRILITIAPKDAPDALRKTQNVAVATSGGIAIAASGAIGCLIYLSLYTFENNSGLAPYSISGFEIIAESKITISALISLLVLGPVSYTHLTLPRSTLCRSRWSPYH